MIKKVVHLPPMARHLVAHLPTGHHLHHITWGDLFLVALPLWEAHLREVHRQWEDLHIKWEGRLKI